MKIIIESSKAHGSVVVPPSKSIAHRALICGALSEGTLIDNIAYSKDITATLDCLEKMGAKIEKEGSKVKIGGLDPKNIADVSQLFCNESGSTLRFLIPLCMLSGKKTCLSGSARLFERPLTIYEDICIEQGILFDKGDCSVSVCGILKSGDYYVPGNISSQFITGLLFSLPLLDGDSRLTVTGKFESASYIDLTLSVLSDFGIKITRQDNVFYINGKQKYSSADYTIEGDCSNAAFLEGFNIFGGRVEVEGIKDATLQGDRVYYNMFNALKCGKKSFDLSDCPDLAPVMFAMAAYCGGAEFTGTARLKIKESDRASAMAEELAKFGVEVSVFDDSVTVHKCELKRPVEILNGHNDHRIVMALSLLCSVTGGEIDGVEAVSKSYPDFFEDIRELGIILKKQG